MCPVATISALVALSCTLLGATYAQPMNEADTERLLALIEQTVNMNDEAYAAIDIQFNTVRLNPAETEYDKQVSADGSFVKYCGPRWDSVCRCARGTRGVHRSIREVGGGIEFSFRDVYRDGKTYSYREHSGDAEIVSSERYRTRITPYSFAFGGTTDLKTLLSDPAVGRDIVGLDGAKATAVVKVRFTIHPSKSIEARLDASANFQPIDVSFVGNRGVYARSRDLRYKHFAENNSYILESGTFEHVESRPGEPFKLNQSVQFIATAILLGEPAPELFEPAFPVGTKVYDRVTGNKYVVAEATQLDANISAVNVGDKDAAGAPGRYDMPEISDQPPGRPDAAAGFPGMLGRRLAGAEDPFGSSMGWVIAAACVIIAAVFLSFRYAKRSRGSL